MAKKPKPTPSPTKGGKTRISPMSSYPQVVPTPPPLPATQGRQGKIFDEIMKKKYDWWK